MKGERAGRNSAGRKDEMGERKQGKAGDSCVRGELLGVSKKSKRGR
jgi:hypothetical protein